MTTTAIEKRNGQANGELAKTEPLDPATMERLLVKGDLDALTPKQKVEYYLTLCNACGLDPTTQPFEYIKLNGKVVLYARKACSDQLRRNNNITIKVVDRRIDGDSYIVTARAITPQGREDEDVGVVSLGKMIGESRANAIMKAHTKAKRRVTLSICGLGMLDESEIESIPADRRGAFSDPKQDAPPAGVPVSVKDVLSLIDAKDEFDAEIVDDATNLAELEEAFLAACTRRGFMRDAAEKVLIRAQAKTEYKALASASGDGVAMRKLVENAGNGKYDEALGKAA
jgi:hypothetical protein